MKSFPRKVAVLLFGLALAVLPQSGNAADPYTINAILSLTGPGAFVGTTQLGSIQALEAFVNKSGGIGGRPLHFAVKDDGSNPQISVQLARDLIAQHVPVIVGPSLTAPCNSVAPLLQRDGPVSYCLTAGSHPPAGGYVFATLTSTPDLIAVAMRYFRERGTKKMAFIVTTDASGQDAEQGIEAAAAAPENKSVQIVAREHFAIGDITVSAQLARIKAANPDVLIAWVTSTAAGTVFRAVRDSGLNVPVVISSANMTPVFIKQFGALFPSQTYAPGMIYYASNDAKSQATRSAINDLNYAASTAGLQVDQVFISAWDPAMLIVDTLKKLGPETSATRVRDSLVSLKGWVGVNGPYDFRTFPQRGLGQDAVVVTRWNAGKSQFDPVSKIGGRAR